MLAFVEAFLAAIGAGAITFGLLFWLLVMRRYPPPRNVDWPLAYDRLWERYLAQDAEIHRLRAARSAQEEGRD
jgi:hypothetical protein